MRALPGREERSSLEPALVTREGLADQQRGRILIATGELVAKRGYGEVKLALIVKRARVSHKTFYRHFANKEECFLELFDRTVADLEGAIEDAAAGGGDWPQQVAAAIQALFECFLSDPLISRAVIVEAPTVGPAITERYQEAMAMLAPLLRRGREFGRAEAAKLPPTLEVTLSGGVIWSAYQCLIVGEVDRIADLLPESVEFVLRPYLGGDEAAQRVASIANT